MIRVYLDNCCFSRLFDDQEQERVRSGTAAIQLVLRRIDRGEWLMIRSDAVDAEVAAIRDPERRHAIELLVSTAAEHVGFDGDRMRRGDQLKSNGLSWL